jgi:hypothetical protein
MLNTSPEKRNWHYGNQLQISPVWKFCFPHLVCITELIRDFECVFHLYRIHPDWRANKDHSCWGSGELIVLYLSENLLDSGMGQCAAQIESEQCIEACLIPI